MSEDIVSTLRESVSSECYLYHIRSRSNTETSTGYIGISNDPAYRFRKHKEKPNSILRNALAKYSDIELVILDEGTRDDMLCKEALYRPTDHIGWNIAPGGGMPPRWDLMTEEDRLLRKEAISRIHKGVPKRHGDSIKLTKAGRPVIATNVLTGEETMFQSVTHAVSFSEKPLASRNGYITRVLKGDRKSHNGYSWRFADRA